jgi:hypothetical protein
MASIGMDRPRLKHYWADTMKLPTDFQKVWLCSESYQEPPWIDQAPSWPMKTETWLQRRRRYVAQRDGIEERAFLSISRQLESELAKKEGGEDEQSKS